jgi:hypothetical protein
MGVALISGLSIALLPTMSRGRIRFLVGSALSLIPLGVEAIGILYERSGRSVSPVGLNNLSYNWSTWFLEFYSQVERGSAEIVWITLLPLLTVLLHNLQRQAYLVTFSLLLFLGFANPLLSTFVISNVTSTSVYYRIFWLFPVGAGLGASLALLVRLIELLIYQLFHFRLTHLPLVVCGIMVVACSYLPGIFVWSEDNNLGPFMTPHLGENLEKIPPDLLEIGCYLARTPAIENDRILCGEEVASFLTPSSQSISFVVTRPGYTVGILTDLGRPEEARERYFLAVAFAQGTLVQQTFPAPTIHDIPRLLSRYRVRFVITSPVLWARDHRVRDQVYKEREQMLQENGFQTAHQGREYVLWERKREADFHNGKETAIEK